MSTRNKKLLELRDELEGLLGLHIRDMSDIIYSKLLSQVNQIIDREKVDPLSKEQREWVETARDDLADYGCSFAAQAALVKIVDELAPDPITPLQHKINKAREHLEDLLAQEGNKS